MNLGNWRGFADTSFNILTWHDVDQLTSFFPVLWALYLLFLPLNKLTVTGTRNMLVFLMVFAFMLFIYRTRTLSVIPSGLPSSDIFFSLTAFISFLLGMYVTKKNVGSFTGKNGLIIAVVSTSIILCSQGMHHYILSIDKKYIFINFYLNFLTVIAFYMLATSINAKGVSRFLPFLQEMALSSLAVFIVHVKIIEIIKMAPIQFPYNIACVYLYSFIFAYSLTKVSNYAGNYVLGRISASNH